MSLPGTRLAASQPEAVGPFEEPGIMTSERTESKVVDLGRAEVDPQLVSPDVAAFHTTTLRVRIRPFATSRVASQLDHLSRYISSPAL